MTEHKPWLSLPDEDPPERGFAELMAAARVKADVMANPPWWKRLFTVARRPPVLALATVVVVLCGVIVVGRPHDQAMSPAPAMDVPAGSLAPRARGAMPEAPPPPPEQQPAQAPLEKKAAPKHEGKAAEVKPVDDVKLGGEKQDATFESETVDQAAIMKAPEVRKNVKAPDPLARCREAAARRDCATAKACVDGAPATYKASAATDAALKSCL
jgi:hypothetical protein